MRNADEEVCGSSAEGGDGDGEVDVVVDFEVSWSRETRRRGAALRSGRRDWESTSAAGEAAAACSGMSALRYLHSDLPARTVQYDAAMRVDNSKNRMSDDG